MFANQMYYPNGISYAIFATVKVVIFQVEVEVDYFGNNFLLIFFVFKEGTIKKLIYICLYIFVKLKYNNHETFNLYILSGV